MATELRTEQMELAPRKYTSEIGDIYFVDPDGLGQALAVAGLARFSRSPLGLRDLIKTEFQDASHVKELLERILFEYGDDSVAQLMNGIFVVEKASNLLTKHLEWGRPGSSYIEESTRFVPYDQRDENGRYKYHTPAELSVEDATEYERVMDGIFDSYSFAFHTIFDHLNETMVRPSDKKPGEWKFILRAQACDAARLLLPVAAQSTVGFSMSAQAIENLIVRLRSESLSELTNAGNEILYHGRMIMPDFLRRPDLATHGGMMSSVMARNLGAMYEQAYNLGLSGYTHEDSSDTATLVDFSPRDEFELVKWMLFEGSTKSMADIEDAVSLLGTAEKTAIMNEYMGVGRRSNRRHKPGRALERVHYDWELVCDYGIFRDLQRHRMVDDLRWQDLNPFLGRADVPALAGECGLAPMYAETYEKSAELYSKIEERYDREVAQYATLLGHKMRWVVGVNAREAFHLHELRTGENGHPGYRRLVQKMHKRVEEHHPIITSNMVFVDMRTPEEIQLSRANDKSITKTAALQESRDQTTV